MNSRVETDVARIDWFQVRFRLGTHQIESFTTQREASRLG